MDTTTQDFSNQQTVTKKSKRPVIFIAIVIIVLIAAGAFLLTRNKSNKPPKVADVVTQSPSPSTTPTPAIDKLSVKIQVLNGTGTPGQATKVAVSLKNAGYNLDNIKTGNVTDTVPATTIAAKSGFESTAADIMSVLNADFPDISVNTSPLDASSSFDIVVTTGGKKYVAPVTPTPTATENTPTPTPTTGDTPTPTPTPT